MPRNASGSGSGQSTGASGCGPIRSQGQHGTDAQGRPDDAMNQGLPRIRRLRDLWRIEREFRQRNALVHGRQALLVDDFEAPLPLEVPEVEIRHECRGERCDDDAVSDRVSHVRLLVLETRCGVLRLHEPDAGTSVEGKPALFS